MGTDIETRYYLADKKSWSDVTTSVISKKTPKVGQVVNVGKVRMVVKDIVDAKIHGKPIIKVILENTGTPYTGTDAILESLMEEPGTTLIEIYDPVMEARVKTTGGNAIAGISPYSDVLGMVSTGPGPGSITGLGSMVKGSLGGIGNGYSVEVSDFGEVVSVRVTYSNTRTGASASQTFAIIYRGTNTKYSYTVYSTAARYRHCNSYQDAAGFIRSKASALQGRVNQI